jgi:hypothetical protein
MMALRAILLAVAALVAAGVPARAQDMFATFASMCIDTDADGAKALAIADSNHWMNLPQALLDKFPANKMPGANPQGRLYTDKDGLLFVVTLSSDIPQLAGLHGNVCAMGAGGNATPPNILKQAADLAGVPSQPLKGMDNFYLWREENGVHISIDQNDPKFSELASKGVIKFLAVHQDAKMSMIMFGIAAKVA